MNSPADRKCSARDATEGRDAEKRGRGDSSDTPLHRKANRPLCPAPEQSVNSQEIIYCVSCGFESLALER